MSQTENIVSSIALLFASDEDFESALHASFAVIGEGLNISRCYLFINSSDGSEANNAYEWCAEGIEPQKDALQHIKYTEFPEWKN